jgi:hypothetical protein
LILEGASNKTFHRFWGSFEPIFESKNGGLYTFVDIAPRFLIRKLAKIIPKIGEMFYLKHPLIACSKIPGTIIKRDFFVERENSKRGCPHFFWRRDNLGFLIR